MNQYDFTINDETGIDLIRCLNTRSSFSFTRKGAEIFSYRVFDKRRGEPAGLLYRDGDSSPPEEGWKNHATVLFPVVGRLKNNESRLGDKIIRFERNHGFARNTVFKLSRHGVDGSRAFLVYSMTSGDETGKAYPFDFLFEVTYTIEGGDLDVVFGVTNTSPRERLYFSCGWHPGFSVTGSRFRLNLKGDNFLRYPVGDDNFLTGEKLKITRAECEKAVKGDLGRALILRIPERSDRECELVDYERNISIGMSFADYEFLGIWRENGRPFICVEPWQGADDFEDPAPFDRKLGIVELGPGRRKSFTIKVRPASL